MSKSVWIITVFLGACTIGSAQAGLVASLPMNEASWSGSAPQVADISGNGHNGTAKGGPNTVASSAFGRVGSFDGNGQYVTIGGSGTITGSRSVVMWVDVQSNTLTYGQPLLTGGTSGAGDFFAISGKGGEGAGLPQYLLYIDHWGNSGVAHSTTALIPNQWNQVAFTYNGQNTIDFYINGVAAGTSSDSLYNYNVDSYVIGGNTIGGTTTNGSLNGELHGLSIYNNQLTSAQILALYQQQSVPEPGSVISLGIGISCMIAACWHRGNLRLLSRTA